MSDMLEKFLNVEKSAASLINEAEAEHAVETTRKDAAAERERKNAEYRQSLSRMAPDRTAFSRAVLEFFEKGGA